jgi:uncharacterized protein
MDRGKLTAILAAVVILVIVFGIGAFLILSNGAPNDDLQWVPTIEPYVNDNAGILSYSEYVDLDDFCYLVELNNTCEIAVLTVNTTMPIGINDYALRTFEKNGIGQRGRDNGILIVLSADEKAWRVVTGAGVANILNGVELSALSDAYLVPYLESGDLPGGLVHFTRAIGFDLVDNYQFSEPPQPNYPISFIPLEDWQLVLAIVIVGIAGVLTKGRIFLWLIYLVTMGRVGGGRGGWGGGRTGGGGSRGRF